MDYWPAQGLPPRRPTPDSDNWFPGLFFIGLPIVVILFLGVWGVDDVILSNVRLDVGQSHHLPSSCSPKVRAIGGNAGTRYTEIIKVDGDRTET